jgi:hypothetical protein
MTQPYGQFGDDQVDEIDADDEFDDEADQEDEDDDMDEAAAARLAEALAQIDAQFGKPPAEQVATYAQAQQTLQSTLARIDDNS